MTVPAGELEFPDAVAVVRSHLVAAGVGVPVVSRVPADRPGSFVEIGRTGGTVRAEVVDGAFITIDSWAETSPAAMELAGRVRRLVHAMGESVVDGVPVGRVAELAGPAEVPDNDKSLSPRVRQSFQVPLRGAPPS